MAIQLVVRWGRKVEVRGCVRWRVKSFLSSRGMHSDVAVVIRYSHCCDFFEERKELACIDPYPLRGGSGGGGGSELQVSLSGPWAAGGHCVN